MNLQAASVPACKPPVTGRFSILPEYSSISGEHSGMGSNTLTITVQHLLTPGAHSARRRAKLQPMFYPNIT
jgi:hypothetical protein